MILERSFLHDFAAGLGEIAGRGRLTSAPGEGYWIEGIDEVLPEGGLALRVGSRRVGHHMTTQNRKLDLSGPHAGKRLRLRPGRDCAAPSPGN